MQNEYSARAVKVNEPMLSAFDPGVLLHRQALAKTQPPVAVHIVLAQHFVDARLERLHLWHPLVVRLGVVQGQAELMAIEVSVKRAVLANKEKKGGNN